MTMKQWDYIELTKTEDIQGILLKLLNEFHSICEENHLIYNLYGGSLLGAVRHQGFIPWDDDVDVSMPRKDYDQFCDIIHNDKSGRYHLFHEKDPNYVYPFSKFCYEESTLYENELRPEYAEIKLYIDVFPIDGYPSLPDNLIKKRFDYLREQKKKKSYCIIPLMSKTAWKKPYVIIRYLQNMIYGRGGFVKYINNMEQEALKYPFEESTYVSCANSWYEKGKMKKDDYLDRRLYQFENIQCWGMRNYHDHLTTLYGDYMSMPPEDKRVSGHDYRLFVAKKLLG